MSASSPDADRFELHCTLNGRDISCPTTFATTLVDLLRDQLGMTGTKVSCDEQICGACTVLVDDRPVSSCTYLAYEAQDRTVTTVEGLAGDDGTLHPVQQAFIDRFAFQCGFCTSGMIMSTVALLNDRPEADRAEIVHHMDGNICRCTGYLSILAAIEQAQTAVSTGNADD